MKGQLEFAVTEQLCTVDHRMHQNVLAHFEPAYITPCKNLILWENASVTDSLVFLETWFFVDIVRQEHVHSLSVFHKPFQNIHYLDQCLLIKPVITVQHLIINAGSVGKSCIYGTAVAAVFFVDCLYNGRMFCC